VTGAEQDDGERGVGAQEADADGDVGVEGPIGAPADLVAGEDEQRGGDGDGPPCATGHGPQGGGRELRERGEPDRLGEATMGVEGVGVAVEVRAGEGGLDEDEHDEREGREDQDEPARCGQPVAELRHRTTTVPVICGWIEQM
jgi:hypothetical protein